VERDTKKTSKPEPKEPYSTPKLTTYGTIQQLTKSVGVHGSPDGATMGAFRTQV